LAKPQRRSFCAVRYQTTGSGISYTGRPSPSLPLERTPRASRSLPRPVPRSLTLDLAVKRAGGHDRVTFAAQRNTDAGRRQGPNNAARPIPPAPLPIAASHSVKTPAS
jgi:hypothetical protein